MGWLQGDRVAARGRVVVARGGGGCGVKGWLLQGNSARFGGCCKGRVVVAKGME